MKILHIINNLGSGGAERLISELLPVINKNKYIDVRLLLLTTEKDVFSYKLITNGIKIDIICWNKISSIKNINSIRKYIKKHKFDIVHTHLFPTQYWVSLASKLSVGMKKTKFITTEHSTYNRRRKYKVFRLTDTFIYSSYSKIISISEETEDNLKRWLLLTDKNKDKFITIENGIDIEKFNNAIPYNKKEFYYKGCEKLICMVGRFNHEKDQETLINAMTQIPESVHLLLVGEGDLIKSCKILVDTNGLQERVHFLGFRNDVERILKSVDIVVLSSKEEGFGLAALEGMAAGKPVIASNVGGLKSIVKGAGLLFDKGNSIELAKHICGLLKDEKIYREVSLKCKERANKYDIVEMARKHIDVYEELNREG